MTFNKIGIDIDYLSDESLEFQFCTIPNDDKNGNPGPAKNYKTLIVYGENGSGKSSIANKLFEVNQNLEEKEAEQSVSFYNIINKHEIKPITKIESDIYSYSDLFLEEKINFTENENLNAIVMLGNQNKIQNKINEYEAEKVNKEKKLDKLLEEQSNYKSKEESAKSDLEKILKADNGWADNDRFIKNKKQKTSVNKDVIEKLHLISEEISENEFRETYKNEQIEYKKKKTELQIIRDKEKLPIIPEIKEIESNLENDIVNVLKRTIEKPVFTEREELILNIVATEGQSILNKIGEDIKNEHCPTCFREINNDLREALYISLTKVSDNIVNKESENLLKEIDNIIIPNQPSLPIEYEKEEIQHVAEYTRLLEEYRECRETYEQLLAEKREKLFIIVELRKSGSIIDIYRELKDTYDLILNKVDKYNSRFDNEQKIKEDAVNLNNKVEALTVKALNKTYHDNKESAEELNEEITDIKEQIAKIDQKIHTENAELKQTNIALEDINKHLKFIFFDDNRLKLETAATGYQVYSKGTQVKLKDLSEGEKKIIGLCYFFSIINQNKSKEESYKEETLVVLDDPISSIDLNNQVGIYSFLRSQFSQIVTGNDNSKVLILTHDLGVLYNLSRVFNDFTKEEPLYYNLGQGILTKMKSERITEGYKNDLNLIYQFAMTKNEDDNVEKNAGIGNLIRRMLESYSTFIYGIGIVDLSTDEEIIKDLDETEREFFQSLMYRLLAHGESHSQLNAQNYSNISTMMISSDERKKLSKLILYFLYKLNSLHLERHIHNFNSDTVKSWGSLIT